MKDDGFHIFTNSQYEKNDTKRFVNAVNFEHPYYYDEKLIKILLKNNGFEIKKIKYFGKCHSIVYVTKKIYKLSDIKYNNFKYNFNLFTNCSVNGIMM